MSDAANPTGSNPGLSPPSTGGSSGSAQDEKDKITTYTIKSVNTGLLGEHVREDVEVEGESYGPGDEVELTEVAHKSLTAMGVKFESKEAKS